MVLVVDDDADARATIRDILEHENLHITEAANGRIALDLLTAGLTPRLVVLDLVMPVMDGVELLRILKLYSRLSAIPVLITSAHDPNLHPETRGRFDAHLQKPLNVDTLVHTVRGLLRVSR